jgi:glucose-1-phosphate thymidylyltransferase
MGKRMRSSVGQVSLDPRVEKFARLGWKSFIPISGKPFVYHQLRVLARLGVREVCLVVGPEHLELKDYFDEVGRELGIVVSFTIQEKPLGTADAVYAARGFAGDDVFLVLNGDNFYPRDAVEPVIGAEDHGACYVGGFKLESLLSSGNFGPERIRSFAVMEVDDNLNLVRIIEKPESPEAYRAKYGVLVNMNLWRFSPVIFEACRRVEPHPVRGELELTTAVQLMIDEDLCGVKVIPLDSWTLDLTYSADIDLVEKVLRRVLGEDLSP